MTKSGSRKKVCLGIKIRDHPTHAIGWQGRTQEGADRAKATPPQIPSKKITYSFKSGAFYVSQFVQRSQFHNQSIALLM